MIRLFVKKDYIWGIRYASAKWLTDDSGRYAINRCVRHDSSTIIPGDDILRVRVFWLTSPLSRSSLEFATASPVILCGVRFYPIFARERAADSLQRRTGFHSFIAAYRVFTGSWLTGRPARDAGLLRRELWDR